MLRSINDNNYNIPHNIIIEIILLNIARGAIKFLPGYIILHQYILDLFYFIFLVGETYPLRDLVEDGLCFQAVEDDVVVVCGREGEGEG